MKKRNILLLIFIVYIILNFIISITFLVNNENEYIQKLWIETILFFILLVIPLIIILVIEIKDLNLFLFKLIC